MKVEVVKLKNVFQWFQRRFVLRFRRSRRFWRIGKRGIGDWSTRLEYVYACTWWRALPTGLMDRVEKAKRSQALIDSIEELIALERDVALATDSCQTSARQVMVPITEVAFMPGIIASDTVMVGLGQDYYLERRPQDAQAVLRRRIADLSEQERILAEGELLVPRPPVQPPQKSREDSQRQTKSKSDKMKWSKGFLSDGPGKPVQERSPPKGDEDSPRVGKGAADETVSPPIPSTEIKYNDSEGREHVVEVEGGEDAPIMEIREWLDESGEQTSVDVTDLGKVLGTTQKALETGPPSAAKHAGDADRGSVSSHKGTAGASPTHSDGVGGKGSSDLDSVLASLEEQEANAEKEAASPALGSNWKKGFLDSGAKRRTHESSATTPSSQQSRRAVGAGLAVQKKGSELSASKPDAFRGTVVEKPIEGVAVSSNAKASVDAAPARVSRFKARRQGL